MKFFTLLSFVSCTFFLGTHCGYGQESGASEPIVQVSSLLKCDATGRPEPFTVKNLGNYPVHYLRIFNRQGRLVFSSRQYREEWPDSLALESKYFYMLQLNEKRISGWVEIDRSISSGDISAQ